MGKYIIYFCSILFFTIFNFVYAQTIEELNYNIISSFPTPGPSPQGLASDSTNIWLSDDSTDIIYKINPTDGSVLSYFNSPGPEPKGLTYDGTYLWNLDDSLRKIYKLNMENGTLIDSLNLPTEFNGLPVEEYPFTGLTWDGHYLWTAFSAGWSSSAIRINPENSKVDTFFFCYAQDMAFDGTYLWNAAQGGQNKGMVSKRDIPSGNRIAYLITPGYYPTGLSFDGAYFWLTDNGADTLYKIQVLTTGIYYGNKYDSPSFFKLHQNYPNPFNPLTTISFQLRTFSKVSLKIYDALGSEISELINEEKTAGIYKIKFDGSYYSSGLYFYVLKVNNLSETKAMLLLK